MALKKMSKEPKHINLNNPSIWKRITGLSNNWVRKLTAGLIDIDQFVLATKVVYRIEGQYVNIRIRFSKNNSHISFRVRVSTFLALYKRLTQIAKKVNDEKDKLV